MLAGFMFDSDMIVGYVSNSQTYINDYNAYAEIQPILDSQQDVIPVSGYQSGKNLDIIFIHNRDNDGS